MSGKIPTSPLRKVAAIGEAMLEFSPAIHTVASHVSPSNAADQSSNAGHPHHASRLGHQTRQPSSSAAVPLAAYQLAFAGDTLNTLFYYQQYAGLTATACYYVTALGDDAMSQNMMATWAQQGLQTDLILQVPGGQPGLYLIHLDADGERSFSYYRSQSAARKLCDLSGFKKVTQQLQAFDEVYLSGISLAIYSDAGLEFLYAALQQAKKNGARIIFDSNYRPGLWESPDNARATLERFYHLVDIALPTFDDAQNLFGDRKPGDTIQRLCEYGVQEIVVKQGASGCTLYVEGDVQQLPITQPVEPVDTTAAGDSFNGAYLAMRAAGCLPMQAARRAQQVAACVVQQHGALVGADLPIFSAID